MYKLCPLCHFGIVTVTKYWAKCDNCKLDVKWSYEKMEPKSDLDKVLEIYEIIGTRQEIEKLKKAVSLVRNLGNENGGL